MSILAANGRLNMDAFSSAFINTFWAPSAVTVAWLVQCGMIDFICIGASRFYFKWGFPKGAEGAPEPLQRAMRAHMNQLENTNHLLFTMWLCALCGRPNFAGGCGAAWVALRHAYGMMYRMRKGDLKVIVRLTTPSYLIVHTLYFAIVQRLLEVAFDVEGYKSYLGAAGWLLGTYLFTLGTAMCQRKHCERWDKENKNK